MFDFWVTLPDRYVVVDGLTYFDGFPRLVRFKVGDRGSFVSESARVGFLYS